MRDKVYSYPEWLQQWQDRIASRLDFNKIPAQATHVQTPLILTVWRHNLQHHPHQDLVEYFLQGISTGFRVGFKGSSTHPAKKSLQSAVDHPTVVDEYLHNEL